MCPFFFCASFASLGQEAECTWPRLAQPQWSHVALVSARPAPRIDGCIEAGRARVSQPRGRFPSLVTGRRWPLLEYTHTASYRPNRGGGGGVACWRSCGKQSREASFSAARFHNLGKPCVGSLDSRQLLWPLKYKRSPEIT